MKHASFDLNQGVKEKQKKPTKIHNLPLPSGEFGVSESERLTLPRWRKCCSIINTSELNDDHDKPSIIPLKAQNSANEMSTI